MVTCSKHLVCTNAPNAELALTNSVYVNPQDAMSPYVNIGNFVYRAVPHEGVQRSHIALNGAQRRAARALPGTTIEVWDFMVPVSRDFTIRAVTIEAQYLKLEPGRGPPADLTSLANAVRSALVGDVITFAQIIVMKYLDSHLMLWVKSDVRGFVTAQTEVGLEWRSDNM